MSFYRKFHEEPLKNSQKVNKMQIPNTSYLKSFKKNTNNRESNRENRVKTQANQHSLGSENNSRSNLKPIPKHHKPQHINPSNDQYQQIHFLMQQTDNSMQQLLNSSINQFQKLIIKEDQYQSLEEQNYRLKSALTKMKNILKGKLQTALQKQKDELSKMLEDYISLITKLLEDKEELTVALQDIHDQKKQEISKIEQEWNWKLKSVIEEHDEQMNSTKAQIQDFLKIIEQYEEEAQNEERKFSEINDKIMRLEEQNASLRQQLSVSQHEQFSEDQSLRIEAQSTKIQTLLQMLEKSQKEKNEMIEELSHYRNAGAFNRKNAKEENQGHLKMQDLYEQIKNKYEQRIQELEDEHEQEFLEYEKAIKDTIAKKDECIERLNLIIEGLRERQRKNADSNHR